MKRKQASGDRCIKEPNVVHFPIADQILQIPSYRSLPYNAGVFVRGFSNNSYLTRNQLELQRWLNNVLEL